MKPDFVVRQADWDAHRAMLRHVREAVFVVEQHVPLELEWDDDDARSAHVIALDDSGNPIGTGRLLPDGHIGRMAVLVAWRRHGVGSAMLNYLIMLAGRHGHRTVRLHAQTHAMAFYQSHGFQAQGEAFMEAGIPHRHMLRQVIAHRQNDEE